MSMAAREARQVSAQTEYRIRGKSYEDLLKQQDEAIAAAARRGRRQVCFFIHHSIYDEWEDRMKQHYARLGYTFKPTGYIGGVLQQTEEICW